ncbi:MAG: TIGR00725 family protein [Thaumarchaeota archaeon]|nr:TIGR00725 family protein [Nitrososphaerota archaeon]
MAKRRQILVIGHNTNGCTPRHEDAAYEVGAVIANSNSVLITGGLGGVMEAASRGASESGGLSVGILPQDDASFANPYCDVVIPTGMGLTRDFLNALSADGIIVVGGGSGTLSEVCAAYMHKKPMVAIRGMGGSVAPYVDGYVDHRKNVRIEGADTPQEAVSAILRMIESASG